MMNKIDWIEKSLQIVYDEGYLNRLITVYPINEYKFRDASRALLEDIKDSYYKKDPIGVVKHCLSLEKFPIDNPYISMIREKTIFEKNLKIVKMIGNIILEIEIKDLETLIRIPKSGSRQFGQSFKSWLKNNYEENFLSYFEFEQYNGNDLKFLKGSDNTLKRYISDKFYINTEKGLDLVFKKKGKTYLGEAKFITDSGGTQTNQLNIALEIAKRDSDNIGSIAIIDGIPWMNSSYLEKIKREAVNKNVLTALLLREYISNL